MKVPIRSLLPEHQSLLIAPLTFLLDLSQLITTGNNRNNCPVYSQETCIALHWQQLITHNTTPTVCLYKPCSWQQLTASLMSPSAARCEEQIDFCSVALRKLLFWLQQGWGYIWSVISWGRRGARRRSEIGKCIVLFIVCICWPLSMDILNLTSISRYSKKRSVDHFGDPLTLILVIHLSSTIEP